MPLYNTATAAAALGVSSKWLDNMLSHIDLDGVQSESQGVSRRLSLSSITTLSLTKDLAASLGIGQNAALWLATRILAQPNGALDLMPGLRISLDIGALQAETVSRLGRAVEVTPTPRRGRPPKR